MLRRLTIFALIALQAAPIALPGVRACIGADGGIAIEAISGHCRCTGTHGHDHDALATTPCCHHHDEGCDRDDATSNIDGLELPCDCAHVALLDAAAMTARSKSLKAFDDGFVLVGLLPSPALVTPVIQLDASVCLPDRSLCVSPSLVSLCALLRC